MKKLLKKYEDKQPEIVFHWKDQEIAHVFAYLMESRGELPMKDAAIFGDISNTIKKALENTYKRNSDKKEICKTAFEIALKQLI